MQQTSQQNQMQQVIWYRAFNSSSSATIPASGLVRITGVNEAEGYFYVDAPNGRNEGDLYVNGDVDIRPQSFGQIHNTFPASVLYEGADPAYPGLSPGASAGETLGVRSQVYALSRTGDPYKTDKAGFVALHPDVDGLVTVDRLRLCTNTQPGMVCLTDDYWKTQSPYWASGWNGTYQQLGSGPKVIEALLLPDAVSGAIYTALDSLNGFFEVTVFDTSGSGLSGGFTVDFHGKMYTKQYCVYEGATLREGATGTDALGNSFSGGICYHVGTGTLPSGTVTSVALSLPGIFSVSGSPVTGSGTLTGTLATQTANTVFAGPTSGGAATPTFRALMATDIPSLDAGKITTGQLATARGGTGLDASAAANGTVLIGNGSGLTLATLTAGSNVTITNGSGTITIAASGGGGLSSPLTTKGDIWVYGSSDTRLPVGTDDYILIADSTQTKGLRWDKVSSLTASGAVIVKKHTITYSQFQGVASGTTARYLFPDPATPYLIFAQAVKHTTSFTGGTVSAAVVSFGLADNGGGTLATWISNFDVFQATGPATSNFQTGMVTDSTDQLFADLNTTGDNVSALTQGSVDIWLVYLVL